MILWNPQIVAPNSKTARHHASLVSSLANKAGVQTRASNICTCTSLSSFQSPQERDNTSSSSPSIPLSLCIESDQRFSAHIIALSEQLRNVHVQRAIWLCAGQELMYARHCCRDGVCRCPVCLEKIEADLASLKIDVRVADGCYEADGGRRVWICRGDMDVEKPCAAWSQSV